MTILSHVTLGTKDIKATNPANGGTDEGQPGPRDVTPDAYGAYLLDPDGNKICAFSYTPV